MYHFIVNPQSRSRKGMSIWQQIKFKLDSLNIKYAAHLTSRSHEAVQIAREITLIETAKTNIIVILGGDGTLNEVINGISSFDNIILGYIPIGSSNDFAKGLELSMDPMEALSIILNPKSYKTIDYCVLNYGKSSKNFIVSSGIGYDASVCSIINTSPIKKFLNYIGLGKFGHAVIGIKEIFGYCPSDATILLDNNTTISVKNMLFTSIHNLKYEGGGFLFCPKADGSDDMLDLCVVENISKLKFLLLLPFAFFGKHILFKEIKNYKCKQVEIRTSTPLPVHTDGETITAQTHIFAACNKEKICVITG